MMALWMVFLEFGLKLMVAERLGLQGAIPPVEAGRAGYARNKARP